MWWVILYCNKDEMDFNSQGSMCGFYFYITEIYDFLPFGATMTVSTLAPLSQAVDVVEFCYLQSFCTLVMGVVCSTPEDSMLVFFLLQFQSFDRVQIIIGDPDAIKESVQELSLPWYSYLLAEVFYTQPFAKLYDIQEQIDVRLDLISTFHCLPFEYCRTRGNLCAMILNGAT